MSQTNTNTNNGENRNQNSGRGGLGRGPSSSGRGNRRNGRGNNSIANKYSFEGKMKDGPISKLLITKTGHRPTQYKKILDTLPVLCADKNFRGLDEVIWTNTDLVETDFMPAYPDSDLWSITHDVQVSTVNATVVADPTTAVRPEIFVMMKKTHVFDANLQKELLSEYERKSKDKSHEYAKFLADKKALITIIYG